MSRRADLAAWAVAAAVFVGGWCLMHTGFWNRDQIIDTPVYENYGEAMTRGDVPYRDFTPEYPPLALPVFVGPALVSHEGDGYRRWFEVEMAACGIALLALVAVASRAIGRSPVPALAYAAIFPVAVGTVIQTRFDLWAALLVVAALAALLSGRDRLGAAVLGAATAAKLFPAVLLPLALAWTWKRRGRRAALAALGWFAGAVFVIYVPFLIVGPTGVLHSIERQLSRPLQIESLGAGLLLAAHQAFGLHIEWASGSGSQNLVGALPDALAWVQTVLQAAAFLWLWIRFARGPAEPERLARYAAAAVVAFVALGKVLSPQFMIWLAPVVALTTPLPMALLAGALVVTQLWFPFRYWDLVKEFDPLASWLVALRDVLLLAVLLTLVRPIVFSRTSWLGRRSQRGSRKESPQSA